MSLLAGVLLGIAVNFIWGLAFLIPYALPSVDPITLTAGRYGSYGLLSILLLFTKARSVLRVLKLRDWLWVMALAFAGNAGYYALVVLAIRLGGVSVAALIIGTLPVTMALYGNWSERELNLRKLMPPLALILGGLIAMNGYKLSVVPSPAASRDLTLGILCAVLALVLWTWYGVQNARYMKRRQEVGGAAWSGAIGVGTLVLTLVALPILTAVGIWSPTTALASLQGSGKLLEFIVASLLLGVVVSWFATVLWNIAARRLPVALAAQLIVFEAVSSVLYASVVDRALPPVFELVCIATILLGVLLGIRATVLVPPSQPQSAVAQ